MPSKELKFTKGYSQDELNAWWKARGLPGDPLTVPDWLSGKTVGRGRDAYGIFDLASGKRMDQKALSKDQFKEAMKFRNDLGKFTDPFREQSGISKVAGGILDVASLALPQLALARTVANAGNQALGNGPATPEELQAALDSNHAAVGSPNAGHDVLPTGTLDRHQTPFAGDYKRYGMGPEHAFFAPGALATAPQLPVGVAPPTRIPPVGLSRGGALARHFDAGGYAADDMSEAAQRARNTTNTLPTGPLTPGKAIYDSTIGGNHVQMYGGANDAMLTDAEALARMQRDHASQMANGSDDLAMWQALNPGATPEALKAYKKLNQTYRDSTGMKSMGTKLHNAAKFELDRAGNLIKSVVHDPSRLLSMDPLSTKLFNTVTGSNREALVGQLGGATENDFKRYEDKNGFGSLGAARALSHSADAIAGMIGGAQAGAALSGALSPAGAASSDAGALTAAGTDAASTGAGALTTAAETAANAGLPEIVVTGIAPGAGGALSGALAGSGVSMADQFQHALDKPGQKPQDTRSLGTKALDLIKKNPGLLIKAGQAIAGGGGGSSGAPAPAAGANGPNGVTNGTNVLNGTSVDRNLTPYGGNYKRYGMGPEHKFYADGGALKHYPLRPKGRPSQELRNFSNLPGMDDPRVRIAMGDRKTPTQFVSHGTGAGGREDNIDAKLSENEYVIDAETVSLLGDGSPEAGAKKLDAMREGIRRHKGQALAKGKISPDAHPGALHYLANGKTYAEGGKVSGVLRAMFKRKPPVDPNAGLRRTKAQLDAALVRTPVAPPRRATTEELNQDVLDLRREVGPQGGDTRPLRRAHGGALTNYRGGK